MMNFFNVHVYEQYNYRFLKIKNLYLCSQLREKKIKNIPHINPHPPWHQKYISFSVMAIYWERSKSTVYAVRKISNEKKNGFPLINWQSFANVGYITIGSAQWLHTFHHIISAVDTCKRQQLISSSVWKNSKGIFITLITCKSTLSHGHENLSPLFLSWSAIFLMAIRALLFGQLTWWKKKKSHNKIKIFVLYLPLGST